MEYDKSKSDGLWEACSEMEMAAYLHLSKLLKGFEIAFRNCYEAGALVPTIPGQRHNEEDMRFAALFLKRALTDLRAVWNLIHMGYTSEAASVTGALFEHALAVNAIAGWPERVKEILNTKDGDLPWSPTKLSKLLAEQHRQEAEILEKPFTDEEYQDIWRQTYVAYKYICKIKHPTMRSVSYEAFNTSLNDKEFVVMAAPDLREEDLTLKAFILLISLNRCYQAIRRFSLALECDTESEQYKESIKKMSIAHSEVISAFKEIASGSLPFNILDDKFIKEWFENKSD